MTIATPLFLPLALAAGPEFLDERFEMPPGFRIYRAAPAALSGGSYDIALDGQGRLLVGDGDKVRRLIDRDGDGVYDAQEVIAAGLGPRGPQGLLLWDDRLYAVGGDGIQLFDGYQSGGPLVHRGRLGKPFHTGGDHDAHTLLRGHDGFVYFISGDGGGTKDRVHITEETSPCLFERSCSVFRFSPDGARWECVGSGGRNSPNVGMNYAGELFSLDSDMEWHVALPWWRPVRVHHWAPGGDQGWQDLGAYPPYYLDNLSGIGNWGRGSPDWGLFYEHRGLPERYRDAYLVCDYQTKSATTGGYETTGRLFAIFLEREGAGWSAKVEVLAKPKAGARDAAGQLIQFALVDIEVAPDGSLLLSDHNQGIWRIIHDPERKLTAAGAPPLAPPFPPLPKERGELLRMLLELPQPQSEWSRIRAAEIQKALGEERDRLLQGTALSVKEDLHRRRRALRYLAPGFADLSQRFLEALARDGGAEFRGYDAWLLGLRGGSSAASLTLNLLDDKDPFVRRRAAEACARLHAPETIPDLVRLLSDPSRAVRYAAMTALAHFPLKEWFDRTLKEENPQPRLRALAASVIRREAVPPEVVRANVRFLILHASPGDSKENRLDLLRVIGLFAPVLRDQPETARAAEGLLLAAFPDPDEDLQAELARLIGEYHVAAAFPKVLAALEGEQDPVKQFHLAQALARLPGSAGEEEERAVGWFLATQTGWFAKFEGKGLQFREFWATVVAEFAPRHREALLRRIGELDISSVLGGAAVDLLSEPASSSPEPLIALYRARATGPGRGEARRRIIAALGRLEDPRAAAFLREEYPIETEGETREAILRALARGPARAEDLPLLIEGLARGNEETLRTIVRALGRAKLEAEEPLARALVTRLEDRRELFRSIEAILSDSSGEKREGFDPAGPSGARPEDPERERALAFWKGWYARRFGRPFVREAPPLPERSDEESRNFLLSDAARGGDADRGRKVYETARCATCHGGLGSKEERIFGPELAGVTRRLRRDEIADSIVYPSKAVADRFKAKVIILKDLPPLAGFITEENDEAVTLVDQERVHRVPRAKIVSIAPQETSLMPERLLARLNDSEIRDLLAFLDELGSLPDPAAAKKGDAPKKSP